MIVAVVSEFAVGSAKSPDLVHEASSHDLARLHARTGLEQVFDSGYGGAHWLASFALLALE